MSVSVNNMLSKFMDLSQEEKQIAADMDAAYKEYMDYCADSEKDLNKKIEEIHKKMDKLNFFIDYARDHANPAELEESTTPFDTSEGQLVSIQQKIQLDSRSDPNAETLYTKATGKKLYYEQEINRTRQLIDGSKVQAKRTYDSEAAKLNKRKEEHFEKVRAYVQSPDFSDYLKLLVFDKSAFNSPGTVALNDDEFISLGQRRVKLSVPMEIEQDLALKSNGEYNAAARTIGAPFQLSVKKGSTLFLEHDERNGQYLLGGIQRLLLNFIKYYGQNLTHVLFTDVDRFSADSLGNIAPLGKGINPFIVVPKTESEVKSKVLKFVSEALSSPTTDKISRILVLQDFPEKYSPDVVDKILELSHKAPDVGVLLIVTHKVPMEAVPAETEIRGLSAVIRSKNGSFWIEKSRESLFWYSAPSDISDEVRKVYIDKRSQDALKAVETTAPAPEPKPAAKPAPKPAAVSAPKPEPKPEPKLEHKPETKSKPEPAPEAPANNVTELELETRDDSFVESRPAAVVTPVTSSVRPAEVNEKIDFDMGTNGRDETVEPDVSEEADEVMETEPVSEEIPAEAPAESSEPEMYAEPETDEVYEDETPDIMSETDDSAQESEDLLFNPPESKHDDDEYTTSVVTELNATLPPPEPDEVEKVSEVAPFDPFAQQDFRPKQEIDPEYTYRITDKKVPKENDIFAKKHETAASEKPEIEPEMTYRITDHPHPQPQTPPEPEHKTPEKPRTSILEAGKRTFGNIVDNIKSAGSAKKVEAGYVHPLLRNTEEDEKTDSAKTETPRASGSSRKEYVHPLLRNDNEEKKNPYADEEKVELAPENISMSDDDNAKPDSARPENAGISENAPVSEPAPAPAPEPAAEPEPVEEAPVFAKGIRKIPAVPLGKNVGGDSAKLDIDGNITYICGSVGLDRTAITERVISHITANTHPDDVELWIFDCGDGEMMKYTEAPAAHIKYLVCDSSSETSIDFANLLIEETERRAALFAEKGWTSPEDIPEDEYLPIILVTICCFPKFSYNIGNSPKFFGKSYTSKLAKVFNTAMNYGIRFLLIGDMFSEGGECPPMLSDCIIHSAVVSANRDPAAYIMFNSIRLYENEIESMKRVPAGCAFIADESSSSGLTLIRIQGENAVNEHEFTPVAEYSQEITEYVNKSPFIGGRKTAASFDSCAAYRKAQIEARAEDETVLFLGEPCRFMGDYPIRMYEDFGENMLVIAPAVEKGNAKLMIIAAIKSLEEQGITPEILAFRSNPVYNELRKCGALENRAVFEGVKAEEHIRDIAEKLDNGEFPSTFQIVLGGDLLAASMEADDMVELLSHVLTNGPRVGMHFMFVQASSALVASYMPLFRYKAVFACPFAEAQLVLRNPECDLTLGGFRLSNDEEELTILPYTL